MGALKYPYYRDNPHLGITIVKDIRGNLEYLGNCCKIDDLYYVKNIDLEYNGKRWVKKEANIYDHELKINVSTSYGLIKGIVGFENNGAIKYGFYSANPYKNCTVMLTPGTNPTSCIDVALLDTSVYIEHVNDGLYYNINSYGLVNKKEFNNKRIVINGAHCPYNIEDNDGNFERQKLIYANSDFPIDRDIRFASNYIKDLTFGIELETINGHLPDHILNTYGIIVCKDGSIKDHDGRYPPEYVTVPLQGAKGIQVLRIAPKEIAKRSDIDIKCSYHLHIGNVKPDRLFLVSLFKLCVKIQNDVFKMFPYYKSKPDGIKEKNYCKKLPKILNTFNPDNIDFNTYINNTYIDVYTFLSGGKKPDIGLNKRTKVNPWGEGKWNIKTRYYWVNFVNLVFHRRETIEFRVHTPTLNSDKIINWLFMCAAIIKYAETFPQQCVNDYNINFIDVLSYYRLTRSNAYADMLSTNLIKYYNERCNLFKIDYEKGDFISNHDIITDKKFTFNALKIN